MNKRDLINSNFRYITTQNCKAETEVWAKFSGYEDTIQYIFYFPSTDTSSPEIMTTTYTQLDMFTQIKDWLRVDFFKNEIKFDSEMIYNRRKV